MRLGPDTTLENPTSGFSLPKKNFLTIRQGHALCTERQPKGSCTSLEAARSETLERRATTPISSDADVLFAEILFGSRLIN